MRLLMRIRKNSSRVFTFNWAVFITNDEYSILIIIETFQTPKIKVSKPFSDDFVNTLTRVILLNCNNILIFWFTDHLKLSVLFFRIGFF